ncbi:MAG: hypothetical protein IT168_16235 [Bryobacterales bacterium]|nr:hypothetical protein [Bryobacterales bacterium]
MGLPAVVLLSLSTLNSAADLRDACHPDAGLVRKLAAGEAVDIRFSVAGEAGDCFKVVVQHDGHSTEGYVPARAVNGREEYERARAEARSVASTEPAAGPRPPAGPAGSVGPDAVSKAMGLLQQNRNGEALAILEAVLRANRRDATVLALAGQAARQSDRIRDAIAYWQESLEMAHSPVVERLLKQAQQELAADRSSQQLIGMRFSFRYDDRSVTPDQARSLVPVLDSEWARVAELLGCRSEERIAAIIQPRDAYLKAAGAAEWSGGQYDGRIRVALLEPTPGEETRQTFAHEIVHACLAQTGSWPAWFHEGLAQKLSGRTLPTSQIAVIKQMARTHQLPSLGTMGQTFARMSAHHAQIAYATAMLAVDLLYQHYGPDGVRSLIQSPERLAQVTTQLDAWLRE